MNNNLKTILSQNILDNAKHMDHWGDFYPTKKDLPLDVIQHFAKVNNLELTRELEIFAKDIFCEARHSQWKV
jgi:hypothetical protein